MTYLKRFWSRLFPERATLSITICFDKGAPLHCNYCGTADDLCVMLEHIPNCGTRLGEQTVCKVKIDVK